MKMTNQFLNNDFTVIPQNLLVWNGFATNIPHAILMWIGLKMIEKI